MKAKTKLLLIGVLLLVAFFIRVYQIESVPASLYYDEVDYGYQARSLIETGKDYRGSFSPFYVHSFNDIRTPLPAYFAVLTTLIFQTPELQVRMPSAISGTLIVLLAFLIVQLWSKNFWMSFLVGLVFATNPWQIQFSRVSHEVIVMMLIFLAALYFFFKSIFAKRYHFLILSSILFGLSVYTYRTMSLFIPLIVLVIFILYRKELLFFGLRKLVIPVLILGGLILPFLYFTTIAAPDLPRINQVSIFSDQSVHVAVQRNREVDSGDFADGQVGKKANTTSYLFHSKPISWLDKFATNYYHSFSTQFLFTQGDTNMRNSIGQMGELLFIDFLPLIFGVIFIYKNFKTKVYRYLFIWLLLAPIPASLTFDGAMHAPRLFIFSAPLLILVGLGWYFLISILLKLRFKRLFLTALFGIWILVFVFYLHRYFVHYPIESASAFGYGFKQITQAISEEESKYKAVHMLPSNDPPMIYFLFWSETPPRDLQEYGSNFSLDNFQNKGLDKYKVIGFGDIEGPDNYMNGIKEDILYMLTDRELGGDFKGGLGKLPASVRLIKLIRYPDNVPAFYLIKKDVFAP